MKRCAWCGKRTWPWQVYVEFAERFHADCWAPMMAQRRSILTEKYLNAQRELNHQLSLIVESLAKPS